ncbi:MAG: glycosyltransferase family 9 protein [Candidatus Brocadiae bacterium]|nr:glycosyltransferase family 9 protein [Candidatus Brocadiia bacterium]
MKYSLRNKIYIDRVLFGFICFFLNVLSRILGLLLKRDHTVHSKNVKSIAISKYLGLGSIIRSTTMIVNLKKEFPQAKILFITVKGNVQFFEALKEIDEVITIDDRNIKSMIRSTLILLFKLWKNKIDLFFNLEVYSNYSTMISILSLARNRYGFFRKSTEIKYGLYTHLIYFNIFQNITDIYLQMIKQSIGVVYTKEMIPLDIPEKYRLDVEKYLFSLNFKKDKKIILLGINANASELCLERRYPSENFVNIIEYLVSIQEKKIVLILIGSPSERSYIQEKIYDKLSSKAQQQTYNACGNLSLLAVIQLIKKMDIFLTNDSGPMHFAFNMKTPTISLWGPENYEHFCLNPQAGENIYLYKKIYCSPCVHQLDSPCCQGNNLCVKSIDYREILNEIFKLLKIDICLEYETLEISDEILGSVISLRRK